MKTKKAPAFWTGATPWRVFLQPDTAIVDLRAPIVILDAPPLDFGHDMFVCRETGQKLFHGDVKKLNRATGPQDFRIVQSQIVLVQVEKVFVHFGCGCRFVFHVFGKVWPPAWHRWPVSVFYATV